MTELPDNARRPLKEGEVYVPLVPDEAGVPEVTLRSVVMGLAFCAVFAMAAAYIALKLGQGIEAAIPISILAVGLSRAFGRRSSLLENVIVQSIGANSSHVVAGAVFTIPALYMLAAEGAWGVPEPTWYQVVLVSFLGGSLGILFLIPLRHYFIVEMHGQFPWPEATATTEILVTGERAGRQARILAFAAVLGAAYDGLVVTLHAMAERVTFVPLYLGRRLAEWFMALRLVNSAAVLGIGYIVGPRYAAIICAGSFLSYFVLVPLVHAVGLHAPEAIAPGLAPIGGMGVDDVFRDYVKIIGIGGIAGAGIMGIISSAPAMVRSIASNLKGLPSQDRRATADIPRVDRSLGMPAVAAGLIAFAVAALCFFAFGIGLRLSLGYAAVGVAMLMAIAFLFAPVSARAIAIIGTNPVSGMTMLTLIAAGAAMMALGLRGGRGMFVTMMVGGVVCTALSASGALSSDLKIGHWIGATPRNQLALKFVGTLVAAVFCGLAMWVMAQAPAGQGFGTPSMPAPQASAMKEILVGIMGTHQASLRWYSFALGVLLSVILRLAGVPPLAFALGMYLPLELNTSVLLGGLLAHLVGRRAAGDSEKRVKARLDRGVLIASGLMAGGAIMGVLDAVLNAAMKWLAGSTALKGSIYFLGDEAVEGLPGELIAVLALAALCTFFVAYSRRAGE